MIIEGTDIEWLGHASFKIKTNGKVIYIDPYEADGEKADVILVTHEHYDHCSIKDITELSKEGTSIVVTPDCLSKVSNIEKTNIVSVEPNRGYEIDNLKIETVPAYNHNKQFHPKENCWVGYVININGKRIYHAGDTDFTSEMKELKNIDIALLPIGGTYTMDAKEAAEAANAIKPKTVIPMHYNKIKGTEANPEELKKNINSAIKVEVL